MQGPGLRFCQSDEWQISLEEALRERERVDPKIQNSMMDARFRFFAFGKSRPQSDLVECAACAKCYSLWVQARSCFDCVIILLLL
jgi:hypothetical protein